MPVAAMGLPGNVLNAVDNTPSDTAVFETTKGVYVGTLGDLVVMFPGNPTSVTFVGISGFLPIMVNMILDTNTTASDIVLLY